MGEVIAGLTAGLLTLFDIDRTFYVPEKSDRRLLLYTWQGIFILFNAVLAAGIYNAFNEMETLVQLPPVLRGIVIGAGWLALFRSKFTTLEVQGRDVPLGLEAFYEAAKGFVYKRINQITITARRVETLMKAESGLAELGQEALLRIEQDALRNDAEKRNDKAWLLEILHDQEMSDQDKRLALAHFILSGQRFSD
ncbi:MAG: hypothetical protein R6X32_12450 [Chloroflexota bacterium]